MRSAYDLETDRTDWRERAACHGEDPELFFAEHRGVSGAMALEQAKAVCGRCPVIAECLAWAVTIKAVDGIWGGKTEAERVELVADSKTCLCGVQFVPRMKHVIRCRRCLDLAPRGHRRGVERVACPVCDRPIGVAWGRITRHVPPGGRLGDAVCTGSTRRVESVPA